MNLATVIVLLVVLGLVVLAVRTLHHGKGSCSCGGSKKGITACSGCDKCGIDCPLKGREANS